ncbi:MAG: acyltransferase domain-containing protein, partial [Thiotrichaceae bacterium]|nr:acyltransferase domain-containing protein [Thiotrichaceae bacterium]
YCAIGSVKTNIGHLDVAAGVTGLIKTVLCLKHKKLVPHLHFTQPNPKIDFANSPFYVNTELKDWQTKDNIPRRAAVSSFGIGGTNAHVVLEESPPLISSSSSRPYQLIVLSARTESALQAQRKQLLEYFKAHADINLNDAAYTLQIGRQAFVYRSIFACNSVQDAIEKLSEPVSSIQYHLQTEQTQNIVFMFPGQGSQYVNMGLELYQTESIFKEHIDYCAQFLQLHLGLDLRTILYPTPEQTTYAEAQLTKTAITQPALFIVEYALSKLWMSWGIQPQAMIGHSIGEYVAACIADVFCLEDALLLVAERGRLMQSVAEGSMLAVPLSESELKPLLIDNLDIAAINLFNQTVVSGADEVIQDFARQLHAKDIKTQVLHTSHAFHSAMMSGILFEFLQALQNVQFNPPQILFISNLTGQWITTDEAMSPDYWVQHLRHTVHFAQGLSQLFDAFNNLVLLEVGPGYTLTKFAKRHPDYNTDFCLPTLRHVDDHISDNQFIQQSLGQLWLANASINWKQFYAQEQRLRIPLPSYPFERKRYWVDVQPIQTVKTNDAMLNREILQRQEQSTNESAVTTISSVILSSVEQQLTEIWQQVLGVQNVGIHDDFFALGGDSLIAVQLIHRINTELQQDISSHGLLDAPTISKLSKRLNIDKNSQQERPFCLVEIQAGNPDKLPLFLVHPVGGHVYIYRDLAKSLGAEQPVYGLQSTVLDGKNIAPETIEQMATQYIQAIQTRQPTGPYLLGGASFGGVVAYEMAQQ